MQTLPIGIQSFGKLREFNCLYVDKTEILQRIIENGNWYFLSRPRRFGKSLTLSTLEAMFTGQIDLFEGLKAEQWVRKQAQHPSPVLRFDVSSLRAYSSGSELNTSIVKGLEDFALFNDLEVPDETTAGGKILRTIHTLYNH